MLLSLLTSLALASTTVDDFSDTEDDFGSGINCLSTSDLEATASVTVSTTDLASIVAFENVEVLVEGRHALCSAGVDELEVRLDGELILDVDPGLSGSGEVSGGWYLSRRYELADSDRLLLTAGDPIVLTATVRGFARTNSGAIRVTLTGDVRFGRDWDSDGYASESLPDCDVGCDEEIADLHDGDCPCDCDDDDIAINPGADEVCDDVDNDCDGTIDVGAIDAPTWYTDADSDGFGDDLATIEACDAPGGTVSVGGDCDDDDAFTFPTAGFSEPDGGDLLCMRDFDGDGFGDPRDDQPFEPGTDCDDEDIDTYPGAPEVAGDGVDQSCDGLEACFSDADADGWRTDTTTPSADLTCTDEGLASLAVPALDCDDDDPRTFPGAATAEAAELRDLCLRDRDEDGWGDATDGGPFVPGTDCDDSQPTVFPGATEVCDGVLNDCAALTLPDDEADLDGDLYTVCEPEVDVWLGPTPVRGGQDCDDLDAAAFPGAGFNEPDGEALLCMRDVDLDGWGDDAALAPIEAGSDCDDQDSTINPGVDELWYDGVDQDCDGLSDYDQDFDGFDAYFFPRDDGTRGEDCDDQDAAVLPGARGFNEACERLVEQDGSRALPERTDEAPLTGCACSSGSVAPTGGWALGLGLIGLLARRRGQARRRPQT